MRIYVDTKTGTYGDASDLVILDGPIAETFLYGVEEIGQAESGVIASAATVGRRPWETDAWLD